MSVCGSMCDVVDALPAYALGPLAAAGHENRAQDPFALPGGGVTWKAQFVSLSTPSNCTGMEAGSTFQPDGTARAMLLLNFSAAAMTRTLTVFASALLKMKTGRGNSTKAAGAMTSGSLTSPATRSTFRNRGWTE